MLIALPKTIADSGHSDDMQDLWLDRVRAEAQRSMARAKMADRRRNQVGAVALVSGAPGGEKGKAAGASLRKAAKQDERKIEAQKGSELPKGEKRFEERSKSYG